MIETLLRKLFDLQSAFDHPVTIGVTIGAAALLVLTPLIVAALARAGRMGDAQKKELYTRYLSWLVLAPLMLGPILLGPGATMLAIAALSLLCYQEFARATGFFRNRLISLVVVVGTLALLLAELDHWYGFFVAIPSLTIALIVVVALFSDRPSGYIQRVALGVLSFVLFGVCFGHLAYMANDRDYRPLMMSILLCVEMNDIFAYITGKSFGRTKLAPNTSPSKTVGGALGALLLTTILFALIGHFVFRGGPLDTPAHLITMGALLSCAGQFGDLVISSIKRDLDVKDMGATIPGHGGLLDRFDSLILVSPALFHYVAYVRGFGIDQPTRILTGS